MTNAELNGVADKVSAVGIIKPTQFSKYLRADASLLVIDCEGAEFSLLEPRNDPILLRTHILVEVHREFGDEHEIVRRFAQTHKITEIRQSGRAITDIRFGPIKGIDLLSAADERRGVDETSWLFLEIINTQESHSRP
jgi:hypothetical protein